MNTPNRRKPENNETNAARQARLRERRKELGYRRVSVWLSPEQVDRMESQGGEPWLGRIVKQLLGDVLTEQDRRPASKVQAALLTAPVPDTGKAALWAEADSLKQAGLSWNEIARRWNEQGRRTDKGAEYRGANIAREVRKGKSEWQQSQKTRRTQSTL